MASKAESRSSRRVGVRYEVVPRADHAWELPEEPMPESLIHHQAVELLKALLTAWAARVGSTQVMRNLAVRWDPDHPKVGVDPDVSVFSPPPPRDSDDADVTSVRTWLDGHAPPILAVEVVSDGNPRKDYVLAPDKYAASGTGELWIFDPKLAGPSSHGGPFRIQIWSARRRKPPSRGSPSSRPASRTTAARGAEMTPISRVFAAYLSSGLVTARARIRARP